MHTTTTLPEALRVTIVKRICTARPAQCSEIERARRDTLRHELVPDAEVAVACDRPPTPGPGALDPIARPTYSGPSTPTHPDQYHRVGRPPVAARSAAPVPPGRTTQPPATAPTRAGPCLAWSGSPPSAYLIHPWIDHEPITNGDDTPAKINTAAPTSVSLPENSFFCTERPWGARGGRIVLTAQNQQTQLTARL